MGFKQQSNATRQYSVNLSGPRKWTAVALGCYWREEAKILEQQGKTKGFEIYQVQILGKGLYSCKGSGSLWQTHLFPM